MSHSTAPIRVGPFGNQNDGDPWDDGVHDGIKKIELSYGTHINSIRVTYVDDGKEVQGPKHGKSTGDENFTVTLDDPKNEKVIKVTAHIIVCACRILVVKSLKFQTTKKTYGPFGPEEGKKIIFPTSDGNIVGFHGRTGTYLNAIGANVVEPTK